MTAFDLKLTGAVVVDGRPAIRDGEHTGALAGRVLRRAP